VLLLALSYLCMNYAFYLLSYWSFLYLVQVRHFAGIESAAAAGVLNTGGNVGGIVCQPIVAALSGAGLWGGAFVSGSVFALAAAGIWLFINSDRRARVGTP
jgi:sugar phosphate permease